MQKNQCKIATFLILLFSLMISGIVYKVINQPSHIAILKIVMILTSIVANIYAIVAMFIIHNLERKFRKIVC